MNFSKIFTLISRTKGLPFCLFFMILFFSISPVSAHNLWIVGDASKNGGNDVHLYFEHFVGPGDGAYLGPVQSRGKTWILTPDGKTESVDLAMVKKGDTQYLEGKAGDPDHGYALNHTSLYGIYHGRLDFFHGKYIDAVDSKNLVNLSKSCDIPFQIIPTLKDGGLLLQVIYFSTPLPRTKISMVKNNGKEEVLKTNNKGEVFFSPKKQGRYHFSALAFENEAAGVFENKAYKGIMHGTTLIIKWPIPDRN